MWNTDTVPALWCGGSKQNTRCPPVVGGWRVGALLGPEGTGPGLVFGGVGLLSLALPPTDRIPHPGACTGSGWFRLVGVGGLVLVVCGCSLRSG
jgi:hypothetical protein